MPLAWPDNTAAARLDNARALYEPFRSIDARVRLDDYPYRRGAGDPWMVLALTDVRDGALTGPPWPWFWDALFRRPELDRQQAEWLDRAGRGAVTLTWLTSAIGTVPLRERRDRFEMFRLAQRVFPQPRDADANDIAVALGGYRRYRGVLLALERLRIATPSTWATLAHTAHAVDHSDDRIAAVMAFQGAIALVTRMWQVGTCDTPQAERLLLELSRAVLADRDRAKAVGAWIRASFTPPYEAAVVNALAGPAPREPRRVEWEGLTYKVDFAAAERERLTAMRAVLASSPLEAAIAGSDGVALGKALRALAYAVAMGDPDGPASLSRDIAERHDLALNTTQLMEEVWAWAPPVERQLQGRPWHVMGSLLGLDLALARLSIRGASPATRCPRADAVAQRLRDAGAHRGRHGAGGAHRRRSRRARRRDRARPPAARRGDRGYRSAHRACARGAPVGERARDAAVDRATRAGRRPRAVLAARSAVARATGPAGGAARSVGRARFRSRQPAGDGDAALLARGRTSPGAPTWDRWRRRFPI